MTFHSGARQMNVRTGNGELAAACDDDSTWTEEWVMRKKRQRSALWGCESAAIAISSREGDIEGY